MDEPKDDAMAQPKTPSLLYGCEGWTLLKDLIPGFEAAAAILMNDAQLTRAAVDQLPMVCNGEILEATAPGNDLRVSIFNLREGLLGTCEQLGRITLALEQRRREIAGEPLPPPDAPDPGPSGSN